MAEDKAAKMVEVRDKIDALDQELVGLLSKRAGLSLEVGRIKAGADESIFKPFREKEVLEKLEGYNPGPLPPEHLRSIYKEIFSSSRALQRPQKAAYLGPEGTFSYFAGVEFLGKSVEYLPMPDIRSVFVATAGRRVDLGIVPLENSLQGTVGQSLDYFLEFGVTIEAEIFCRISHSLLSNETDLSSIEKIYSHPQPLAQCGNWLRSRLPNAPVVPMESTAAAARKAAGEKGAAAVGHKGLGQMYGLNVLFTAIEDLPDNWTRFVVVGPADHAALKPQGAKDKTSMLFTLPDRPGALAAVLNILAKEGINMKKLESRPLRGEKWKYVFFADVECDLNEEQYSRAMHTLSEATHTLRILGGYPSGPYLDVSGDPA